MPIVKTSSTYADEFNTGTSTTLNANVGDIITATHNVYYENTIDANVDSDYTITASNDGVGNVVFTLSSQLSSFILLSQLTELIGKNITTLGFDITNFVNKEVLSVTSNSITIDDTTTVAETAGDAVIYDSGTIGSLTFYYSCRDLANSQLPALDLSSGVIPTFETTTNILNASDTVTIKNIPFKYEGAYQTGSLTSRGTGITTSGNIYNRQAFELIHTFKVTPISIYVGGGELKPTDFVDNSGDTNPLSLPLEQINAGALFDEFGSADYQIGVSLKNNPSDYSSETPFININDASSNYKVSVIGQKYLGGITKYSFTNLSIIRTSDSAVSGVPLVSTKFTVSFDVENTEDPPFLNSSTIVKMGIENIPQTIDNAEDYEQTFLNDEALTTLGASAIIGSATGDAKCITNATSVFNSTSSITCSFDVDYKPGAETQIIASKDYTFSIYVTVQNHTLDYTNSDRVTLQPFIGNGILDILVDPVVIDSTVFLPFKETLFANGIANTAITGYPTQLLVGVTQFTIDWANRSTLRLNSINQQLVFVNSSTLEEFVVDSDTLNTSGLQLIGGLYPLGGATINKGFKIPATEVRNFINFINDGDVADAHTFQIWFPFFLRWEYYTKLFLNSVPSTIIDTAEDFDGVNYDLFRIDQLANWTLNYRLNFTCFEGVELPQTFDLPITLVDYDADVDTVSREIKSYTEDETTELTFTGVKYIQNKDNTLIYVEWDTGSTVNDVSDFEIEILAEPKEGGAPNKIQRISSVNNLLASSWFTDNGAANGLVAKSISGNKAVGKVLIDKDKLSFFSEYRLYGIIDYIESVLIFTFQTNINVPLTTFDPAIISSDLATWELVDGTTFSDVNSLSISTRTGLLTNELNGTIQDVVLTMSGGVFTNITTIDFNTDNIYGVLDLSLCSGLTAFTASSNADLTSIINPTSSAIWVNYYANSCNLTGTLNLSGLSGLGKNFQVQGNSLLTSIINPTSSEIFITYIVRNCDLTGVLNVSTLTGLGGTFYADTNANLTEVLNPVSSTVFGSYHVYNCGLVGELNLVGLTGLGGNFQARGNPLLTSIVNPTSSTNFTFYYVYSCNLTGVFDVSGLTGLGGDFRVNTNPLLAGITNPISNTVFIRYWAYSCNISSLDFTPLTGANNNVDIRLQSNTLNAANCQTIIDDLATKGWTGVLLNLSTQTPALTTIEKNALIASAGYITVVTTNSGTITL